MALNLCPVSISEAQSFVRQHHRHHDAPQGGLFAVAAETDKAIVAVAIIGRPVSRRLQDGYTAEITRLCSDGTRNSCSMLYRAAWRACRALGYRRLVTYILGTEPGTSLRAAGYTCIGQAGGGSWNVPSRPRVDKSPTQKKLRWEMNA